MAGVGLLAAAFRSTIGEGIASGELIDADWMQIQLASLGANVMYFLSAPVWRLVLGIEPMKKDALAVRRKALVDFLGQAIFRDRKHGAKVAAQVFADTPMPEIEGDEFVMGRKL